MKSRGVCDFLASRCIEMHEGSPEDPTDAMPVQAARGWQSSRLKRWLWRTPLLVSAEVAEVLNRTASGAIAGLDGPGRCRG